jgi:hypothetical protein
MISKKKGARYFYAFLGIRLFELLSRRSDIASFRIRKVVKKVSEIGARGFHGLLDRFTLSNLKSANLKLKVL